MLSLCINLATTFIFTQLLTIFSSYLICHSVIRKTIMGVFTYTMADITSPVAPTRFFQAQCIDSHNTLPKIMPNFIQRIEVQGDPTLAGCVKQVNFNLPEGQGRPFKYLKNRVNEIDSSKFYINYTTFEGDVLGDNLECTVIETTYEPSGDGTNYKSITHFHTKGDYVITEEEITGWKEATNMMFKAVEDYLITNPQVYAST